MSSTTRTARGLGRGGRCNHKDNVDECASTWLHGDVIKMTLDCDEHTLTMTNERTGEKDTIDGLPDKTLYPSFSFAVGKGDTLELVD